MFKVVVSADVGFDNGYVYYIFHPFSGLLCTTRHIYKHWNRWGPVPEPSPVVLGSTTERKIWKYFSSLRPGTLIALYYHPPHAVVSVDVEFVTGNGYVYHILHSFSGILCITRLWGCALRIIFYLGYLIFSLHYSCWTFIGVSLSFLLIYEHRNVDTSGPKSF